MSIYQVYGLKIKSELSLPQLQPSSGEPDVIIRYGTTPPKLEEIRGSGVCYQAKENQLLLKIEDICSYYIQNGNSIVIDPVDGAANDTIRLFLLGSAFGALLHQRGLLVLHGSAIVVEGEAVIFLGNSGVGKSTLATAFAPRGYPVATDDVSAVSLESGVPCFPGLKLWHDTCEKLGVEKSELSPVRPELKKYFLPLQSKFLQEPLPLKKLYVLRTVNRKEFELDPITGKQQFFLLGEMTYRLNYMKAMGYSQNHFPLCLKVAKQTPLARLHRPSGWFLLDELVELIEDDLLKS